MPGSSPGMTECVVESSACVSRVLRNMKCCAANPGSRFATLLNTQASRSDAARETGAPALHRITPLALRAAVRPGRTLSRQPCAQGMTYRPYSLRPRAGRRPFPSRDQGVRGSRPPQKMRGDGAPMKRVRGNKRIISFGDDAAPLGAPSRRLDGARAALFAGRRHGQPSISQLLAGGR